jgi:hypothetical protein
VSEACIQTDMYMLVHMSHKKHGSKFRRAGWVFVCSELILTVISSQMVGAVTSHISWSCESCCLPLRAIGLCVSMPVTCLQPVKQCPMALGLFSAGREIYISYHWFSDFQGC